MPSNGSTVVNKTSKFAVFDVKGGEQRGDICTNGGRLSSDIGDGYTPIGST